MSPTVYLVSGANRGIGLGLVTTLASRPDTVVFAGARNPDGATELNDLVAKHTGRVHVVKLVSGDEEGNKEVVREIRETAGRLDVVIANAGISSYYGPAESTPASAMTEHYEVNVVGTLVLFQACIPLLRSSSASSNSTAPKFVVMTSGAGLSARAGMKLKVLAYGCSKAAENFLARRLHFEHEKDGLVCFAISPGPVRTGMSDGAVEADTEAAAAIMSVARSVDEAAPMLVKLVDEGTRDNYGGRVVHIDRSIKDF